MKRYGTFLILFLTMLSLAAFKRPQGEQGWVYEQEKKGIKIFTKKGKWSKLRDSKAVMTVSSTPDAVLKILMDFDHYSNWISRCDKSGLVARLNENEYIVHLYFNSPWPIKDRDCVIRIKVDRNPKTGVVVITETSEPKYVREEDDIVRIQQMVATWKLIPKGNSTEVIHEYSSNPGGNIPDWLTNTQSVETPLATFENLQERTTTEK